MTRLYAVAALAVFACSACDNDPSPSADTGVPTDAADATDVGDSTDDATPDIDAADVTEVPDTVALGAWSVHIDQDDGSWAITPPYANAPKWNAPPTMLDNGDASVRVADGAPFFRTAFGAFEVKLDDRQSDLVWHAAADVPTFALDGDALTLTYAIDGLDDDAVLRIAPRGDDLEVTLNGPFDAGEIAWGLQDDEAYFGLGSQVTGMDLRGRTYPLFTQEQGNGKPERPLAWPLENYPEAAYAPMGVWWSSNAWTALITHDAYSEIDLGETDANLARLRSYAAQPGFVLLDGGTPADRMASLTSYTGRLPYTPPAWLFGPWNDVVGGGDHLRELATRLRDNNVPSSAIWAEDWIGGSQTATGYRLSYAWEWDPDVYPDLPNDIEWLHDNGFAFLGYFNTFVPDTNRMWDEGVDNGYLMVDADGEVITIDDPAFRTAGLIDLTNPDAQAWMADYMREAADTLGVDGWMADFTEWAPLDAVLHSGEDPWRYHNRFPLDFQRTITDTMRDVHATGDEANNNWAYWARSGWASVNGGSGGLVPAMWGGDQNTNWERDDGFPTVVPIAAHLGMSGVPIFGSDIAGYNALFGEATTKELFFRWSAMGALQPLMRTHHGSNECKNWSFDRDDDTLTHYRRYASLHVALFPYFRLLSDEAVSTGMPITRHPYLVAPNVPTLWRGDDHMFFVGNDVLVAPVLEQGAESRPVALPSDGWWPLFGDGPVSGPEGDDGSRTVTADASFTELPMYVRPGTILPMLRENPDSMYGANASGVTDLEDSQGLRWVLYPDADGVLTARTFEGHTASGAGWQDVEALTAAATWNDTALSACADPIGPPCVDGGVVYVSGSGTLAESDATFTFSAPGDAVHAIHLGGTSLPFAEPTAVGDINAVVPPPCEEE